MAKGQLTVRVTSHSCAVEDCSKPISARGWCSSHYARWHKHGTPDAIPSRPGSTAARQWKSSADGVECPYCGYRYASRGKLTKHCQRLHADELPIRCSECNLGFMDERGKQTHMGRLHPDVFVPMWQDPAIQREGNLKSNYGIGIADYERLLAEQGGTCACCDATEADQRTSRLSVDHCHTTGAVRGLLCSGCNFAIGNVADSPERLRRLADYLAGGR